MTRLGKIFLMLKIISVIYKNMAGKNWDIFGLLHKNNMIFPVGNDSKILGSVFEILMLPILRECANELNCNLKISQTQTVYPDYWFEFRNNRKIAVDIKSTYRRYDNNNQLEKFGYTLGSYTSYIRDGKKNIEGYLCDYDGHLVVGFLYDRQIVPPLVHTLENESLCVCPYYNVTYFVQEKYKICGQKPGSGNTTNIGSIQSKFIESFHYGLSYFRCFGEKVYYDYWGNFRKDMDGNPSYEDIEGYFYWLSSRGRSKEAANLKFIYDIWKAKYGLYIFK